MMTLQELSSSVITLLTRVGSNRVTAAEILLAVQQVIAYFATQLADIIPDWTDVATFKLDGTSAGKYCKYPDSTGKKRIFETKVDNNINHLPPTDPSITENTYWKEVSASAAAAIPEHAAGIYGPGLVIVFHNHSVDGRGLYVLLDPVRPYSSTNIETEITAGKWERIGGSGGGGSGAWGGITGTLTDQTDLTTYIAAQIAALVASAPGTLDTLNELAAALGDDPNFAATITTQLGLKELLANKATSFAVINNTLFPSVKAVNDRFAVTNGYGLLSARPAASADNLGYQYFASDAKTLTRSNGVGYDVISISGAVINVKDFGVLGDGVTNDGPALNTLIASLAADSTLFFPSGTYLINTNVAINKRLYVTGQFPVLTTTANISIMTVTVAESKLNNLIFRGQGKATASRTAQFGLNINGVGRTMTTNCTFTDFPGGGFFYQNTYVSPGAIAGVVGNCVFYSNKIGIASGSRGEYFAITGCISNANDIGINLTGGNNLISNCNFNYDVTGLEIVSGTNNAHGVVSNSNFNHCTTWGINAHNFTLGQTFSNIHVYESPIRIADCTGAKFLGGTLDCDTYTFTNATSLSFENTSFGSGYSPSITLSGTNSIAYINCHHIDGRIAYDAATFGNTNITNFVSGTVQTTDATTLNTVLAALTSNTAAMWKLCVVARITSVTNINDLLAAELVAATKMSGVGTGTLEGAVVPVFTAIKSASMAAAAATLDVNADNLRAVFNGLAGTTIKWDYRLTALVD